MTRKTYLVGMTATVSLTTEIVAGSQEPALSAARDAWNADGLDAFEVFDADMLEIAVLGTNPKSPSKGDP